MERCNERPITAQEALKLSEQKYRERQSSPRVLQEYRECQKKIKEAINMGRDCTKCDFCHVSPPAELLEKDGFYVSYGGQYQSNIDWSDYGQDLVKNKKK